MLTYYMIVQIHAIVDGLRVYPERMLRNLDSSFGLVFSQPVLLALVEAGQDPRRCVPASCSATRCARGRRSARSASCSRPTPTSRATLDDARLDACFDLKRALANSGRVFDALDALGDLLTDE